MHCRDKSEQYSKFYQRKNKDQKENTMDLLNSLELAVADDPGNEDLNNRINNTKQKLEIISIEEAKMASIRAGVKWIQEGEKSNKYFLGLEKCRNSANTINALKKHSDNTKTVTSSEEILKELSSFYKELFQETKTNEIIKTHQQKFMSDLYIPKLDTLDSEMLEYEISEHELLTA